MNQHMEHLRRVYHDDVALLARQTLASIIHDVGFSDPIAFGQSGIIHALVAILNTKLKTQG
jgi:hypothetical protein